MRFMDNSIREKFILVSNLDEGTNASSLLLKLTSMSVRVSEIPSPQ